MNYTTNDTTSPPDFNKYKKARGDLRKGPNLFMSRTVWNLSDFGCSNLKRLQIHGTNFVVNAFIKVVDNSCHPQYILIIKRTDVSCSGAELNGDDLSFR